MIRARGFDVLIDSGDVARLVLGTIAMSALWAAIGVGVGALVRNQVFAIVGLFAWVFVVEILLFQYLPGVARYAPGAAGNRDDGRHGRRLIGAPALGAVGGAVLAAYAAAFVSGAFVTNRRDVTMRQAGAISAGRPRSTVGGASR